MLKQLEEPVREFYYYRIIDPADGFVHAFAVPKKALPTVGSKDSKAYFTLVLLDFGVSEVESGLCLSHTELAKWDIRKMTDTVCVRVGHLCVCVCVCRSSLR